MFTASRSSNGRTWRIPDTIDITALSTTLLVVGLIAKAGHMLLTARAMVGAAGYIKTMYMVLEIHALQLLVARHPKAIPGRAIVMTAATAVTVMTITRSMILVRPRLVLTQTWKLVKIKRRRKRRRRRRRKRVKIRTRTGIRNGRIYVYILLLKNAG